MKTATILTLSFFFILSCKKKDLSPPPPSGIVISHITDTSSTISWQSVSNATKYQVFISTDSTFKNYLISNVPIEISATNIDISGLQPLTKYFVGLKSVVGGRTSDYGLANFTTANADRFVYIGGENNVLYALDARTGLEKWRFVSYGSIYASPTVKNGILYFGSADRYVYAIDAINGIPKWSAYTENTIYTSTPTVANGMVYIGTYAGNAYAFDALTGQQKWMYSIPGTYINIGSSPIVMDTLLYIGSYDNNLYALNALNGTVIWEAKGSNPILSSPALWNNTIYIGWNVYINAFDAITGATKWSSYINNSGVVSSSPTVNNGLVFIGGIEGKMHAYDANSGVEKWNVQLQSGSIVSSPVIANNTLYVGSGDGTINALDPLTGSIKWSNTIDNKNIYSGPAVSVNDISNTLYTATLDGEVVAMDAITGKTKWINSIGARFTSSPCVITYKGSIIHPGISGDEQ